MIHDHALEAELAAGRIDADAARAKLVVLAHEAATSGARAEACRALGAIAGRAYGASWEVAERAAFDLLGTTREIDAPAERARLLGAMGRAFQNAWLMPYVHSRLSDEDESVVCAAIGAAGGLAFPALEETLARFLDHESRARRIAAIAALGRMGAESAAARLVPLVASESIAALGALTEIRSNVGEAAALEVLAAKPSREIIIAAVRYLAEIGCERVTHQASMLVRSDNPELRMAASTMLRVLESELRRDAGERILTALTETDRAARASLARRLRTLPVQAVLEQAEVLLADDAEGVIQIVAEVRAPEVTRFFLRLAKSDELPIAVRARAAGSIEANEPWERDALVELIDTSKEPAVRATATQTLGAFADLAYLVTKLGHLAEDRSPDVRGAFLWAIQIAARPRDLPSQTRARAEELVTKALRDADATVRRRAAYVAGNFGATELVTELVELARRETDRADLRVAAFVALGDMGAPARFADLVFLWNREDDANAMDAVSRAMERSLFASRASTEPHSAPPSLARAQERLKKLFASPDARVRAAAARVAGLTFGGVPIEPLVHLATDDAPRVRGRAVVALGRIGGPAAEPALVRALSDVDPAVQERAAEALLLANASSSVARVIDFVSHTVDRAAAARLASRIHGCLTQGSEDALAPLGEALARLPHDDPAYEMLLAAKLRVLEAMRPAASKTSVDAAIAAAFPTWSRLSAVRSFEPLARSLRTAEMLQNATTDDADMSAPIILWMKCLEGYFHAWLGPRLRSLQERPAALWELTDRVVGPSWPAYQRWLAERWSDPVQVGALSVEVPLRSVTNGLRELQERKLKSLDSPISMTEWGRIMLFFAVDHPSGPRNVLKVNCTSAERAAKLAHRLQVLAQVRNVATHRAASDAATLAEFRRAYYGAFEEVTSMA